MEVDHASLYTRKKDLYKTKIGKLYTYNGNLQLVIDYYEEIIDEVETPCYVIYVIKKTGYTGRKNVIFIMRAAAVGGLFYGYDLDSLILVKAQE